MKTPEVSIILATYNRAHTLPRAIESVINQSFTNWELIIVDDGSIDSTEKVVKPFTKDARITYHKNSHLGRVPTKNLGARLALASMLTFIDSDDYYKPEHLQTQMQFTKKQPEATLWHSRTVILGNKMVMDMRNSQLLIDLDECVIGATFFIRRKDFLEIGGFPDVEISEDYALAETIKKQNKIIAVSNIRTYVYDRTSNDSLSKNFAKELVNAGLLN